MDTQDQKNDDNHTRNQGRILGGLFLLALGTVFVLKESNYFLFPYWLFTWPMILIAVGAFIGIRHGFRGPGWLIMIVIGSVFLFDQVDIGIDLHRYLVPAIIIAVGLTMILRPKPYRRKRDWDKWSDKDKWRDKDYYKQQYTGTPQPTTPDPANPQPQTQNYATEDFIDSTSIFGNVQKIVVSKNFRGGDITCFMGGAEIDLTQADINGKVTLDVTCVMGGAKLIVPQNWEVKSEVSAVFGGIEDKRQVRGNVIDFNKVLVLKGTVFMGGIEIRSF